MLNRDVQNHIDRVASLGLTPPSKSNVAEARSNFAYRRKSTVGAGGPDVAAIEQIRIPTSSGALDSFIYRPECRASHTPTLVFLHGGGWVMGSSRSHDIHARTICSLCQSTILSVNYRLAPENPFPAAANDARDALAWASQNLSRLGGVGMPLGVAGDSAGGNLAAVAALDARNMGIQLSLQLLLYPAVDARGGYLSLRTNGSGYGLTLSDLEWYYANYHGGNESLLEHPRLSPLCADDHNGLAPAVVAVAQYDALHDEGLAYAAKLAHDGTDTLLMDISGLTHGFFSYMDSVPSAHMAVLQVCSAASARLHA